MPLRKLQEIIVDYVQHIDKLGRSLARQCSVDYPYKGSVFSFQLKGDRLDFTDNTQAKVTSQDGRETMESIDCGRFGQPQSNKAQAAFLKFEYWQNRILGGRDNEDPERMEREFEIMTRKLLPLAVEILKSTTESYSMPDPLRESGQDYWTHPICGLSLRNGMLKSRDLVPAKIQLKAEQLNDFLREMQRRIKRARAIMSQTALSKSPEDAKNLTQLVRKIVADYEGEMIRAGQRKGADAQTQYPSVPVMKEGANPFPSPVNPMPELMGDAENHNAKNRYSDISEASLAEYSGPRPKRRKGRTNPRKTKTGRSSLLIAAERYRAVQAYIDEVLEKTGKRITRTDI
jgi:hypothetical protein